jgi:hypothetical protein
MAKKLYSGPKIKLTYQPHAKLSTSPNKKLGNVSSVNPGRTSDSTPWATGKDGKSKYPSTHSTKEIDKKELLASPKATTGMTWARWTETGTAIWRCPAAT